MKKSMSVCRYCGCEMRIRFDYANRYVSYKSYAQNSYSQPPFVYFECPACKSRSPIVELDTKSINLNNVSDDIESLLKELEGDD